MPRNIHYLTLASIKEMESGSYAKTFDELLRRASLDCMDRPHEEKPRVVTMKVQLVPVPQLRSDGSPMDGCDEVRAIITFDPKNPVYRTRELSLGTKANGSLVFNPDCLSNIKQMTLLDDEEAE